MNNGRRTSIVTSSANPRVKAAVRLRKRRERDATGLMLIEGVRELICAIDGGIEFEECFFEPALAATAQGAALRKSLEERNVPLTAVAPKVFEKLAYREESGGFAAVAVQPKRPLADLPSAGPALYLVIDAVEKPGNIGAVIRSADAAGATGLIVSNMRTDLYNPNVIRASLGTVFTTPVARTGVSEILSWAATRGIALVTATPRAAQLYTSVDYTKPTAFVVGSEDRGLGPEWLDAAPEQVRIPMSGRADSLNVSAAATVLLYEALRQRTATQPI
jgi:TrmH family RNA methyltransferase